MNEEALAAIQSKFPSAQLNAPLAKYSNYRIGGPAAVLLRAQSNEDLIEAVTLAREREIPWRVLGGGSNTLISDKGFDGFAIIAQNRNFTIEAPLAIAEAGVLGSVAITLAARAGLGGLECLAGVPGTIGGAMYGNAGSGNAGGSAQAIGDRVITVDVLTPTGELKTLTKADCDFRYRSSRFKKSGEIILRAVLQLVPGDATTLTADLVSRIKKKNTTQPTSAQSAGCMFQNVQVPDVAALPEELREHVIDGHISAWRLIAAAGLQGYAMGGIQVSEKHANFLVNKGDGTAEQVIMLMSYLKQQIRDKYGLQLHNEVQLLGFE